MVANYHFRGSAGGLRVLAASPVLIALLSLGLAVTMARAQSDGGAASAVRAEVENPQNAAPTQTVEVRSPSEHEPTVLEFDQRLYGTRNYTVDPAFRAGNIGSLDLPSLSLALEMPTVSSWTDVDLPFVESIKPEDALVHLGPFKLDADRAVAALVLTDNAGRTHGDRDATMVSIIGIEGIRAIWELTDNTQIALEGDLIALPFEDEMGLNGFGLRRDTLALALGAYSSPAPIAGLSGFRGEFSTGFDAGGWSVVLRDSFGIQDFRIRQGFDTYLDEELTMLELDVNPGLQGGQFEELGESRFREVESARDLFPELGGGQYGEPGPQIRRRELWERTTRDTRYDGDYDDEDANLDFTNNLSLSVIRNADASIRPVVTVFRRDSDYWYADQEREEDAREARPEWYEGATIGLVMDRPSMRFPPYISYTFVRDSDDPEWDKTMRLGISGPGRITDYIHAHGNIGLHTRSDQDEEDERDTVYEFYLAHQPRPMTTHSIDLVRYVEEPEDRLRKQVTYRLRQGLGPRLALSFAASRSESDRDGYDEEEWGVGGSLGYTHDNIALAWRSYYEQEWDEDTGKEDPDFRHQIEARVRLGPRIRLRYLYEWEDEGSDHEFSMDADLYRHKGMFRIAYRFRWCDTEDDQDRQSYIENLIVLTAVRDLEGWSLGRLFGGKGQESTKP